MTDIYKGLNPIYENLKLNEEGQKHAELDPMNVISGVVNQFFNILLNSKMENSKTVRGFQEIKNKILGTTTYGAFKQYIISVVQSLAAMDIAQKEQYQKNIQFMGDMLNKLDSTLSNPKQFDSIKKTLISKLLENYEADLKEREEQMKKTSPQVYKEVVDKGLIVKEAKKRSGDETSVEEGEFRGKVFNKSKESLDAATSFVGMIDRDKYTPALEDNADIKRYEDIAKGLLEKAKGLQMTDRKGLWKTIVTPSGEIKRSDYLRQQDNLINEIIRQKKEYDRIRTTILKEKGGVVIPSTDIICPPGKKYDASKGICVTVETNAVTGATYTGETYTGATKTGATKTDKTKKLTVCAFPIALRTKCSEVGTLQAKLMELIPSIKNHLDTKGGVDNIYGKGTSAASNIVWGYISGKKDQALDAPLTKEMYDSIIALTKDDIDLDEVAVSDSKNTEMSIEDKIEEIEQIKESAVLSFDDFYAILEESYSTELNEDGEAKNNTKKIKDSCVKDSLASGKIVDCDAIKKDDTGKDDVKNIPTREDWKGLKYVETGTYPVAFDESLLSAWTKEIAMTAATFAIPGSGLLLKAGSTSLKGLAVKGAQKIGSSKLAKKLGTKYIAKKAAGVVAKTVTGKSANRLSAMSAVYFRQYKRIPIPKRLASGLIGGTIGAAALDFLSGRNAFTIEVIEGYIDNTTLYKISNGLVDTLDGYVSDDDWACISTILAIIKGSWTIKDEEPVSAWKVLKEYYLADEGETLPDDIRSVSAKTGDVEGYPKLKSPAPLSLLSETPWDLAKAETISFLNKLESNEEKMAENIKTLPKDYIEAFESGNFDEYDENGNIEGKDITSSEETDEETSDKDTKTSY